MVPQVILYNQSGESFLIFEQDWWELCETAEAHGWKPAGTAQPPIRLDIDNPDRFPQEAWDHDYRVPQQQTVLRHDARAMAAALRLVEDPERFTLREAFIDFCGRGGFILCPEARMDLHSLERSIRDAPDPRLRTSLDREKSYLPAINLID